VPTSTLAPSRTQEDLLGEEEESEFNKNRIYLRKNKTIETTTNGNI